MKIPKPRTSTIPRSMRFMAQRLSPSPGRNSTPPRYRLFAAVSLPVCGGGQGGGLHDEVDSGLCGRRSGKRDQPLTLFGQAGAIHSLKRPKRRDHQPRRIGLLADRPRSADDAIEQEGSARHYIAMFEGDDAGPILMAEQDVVELRQEPRL